MHPYAPRDVSDAVQPSSLPQGNKRVRGAADANPTADLADKWAEEFAGLEEDDQYTYIQTLAGKMTCAAPKQRRMDVFTLQTP